MDLNLLSLNNNKNARDLQKEEEILYEEYNRIITNLNKDRMELIENSEFDLLVKLDLIIEKTRLTYMEVIIKLKRDFYKVL